MPNYILILISVLLAAAGQLLLKKGAISFLNANIFTIFRSYFTWFGLICYFLGSLSWIMALSKMKLTTVYPFASLIYVLVIIGAYFFFNEKITISLVIGSLLIIAGLIFLNS